MFFLQLPGRYPVAIWNNMLCWKSSPLTDVCERAELFEKSCLFFVIQATFCSGSKINQLFNYERHLFTKLFLSILCLAISPNSPECNSVLLWDQHKVTESDTVNTWPCGLLPNNWQLCCNHWSITHGRHAAYYIVSLITADKSLPHCHFYFWVLLQ